MKVERLNVGWFTTPAGVWRQGDAMDVRVRYPVPAYLIETGSERILVDTGLHPDAAEDVAAYYGGSDRLAVFELEQERSVADQLELDAISRVILTHLHFDHAGAVPLLPSSVPVVLQRSEWEATRDPEAVERNFFQAVDYEGIADQLVLVDGDHDLLGDGSILLLSTPGHTPGHQAVQVGDGLVISGDAIHYADTLDDRRLPVFADDFGAQAASLDRLAALRDAGLEVLPGHDPERSEPGAVPLR
jgi:glyoxylase-like metal-dependent hydrolase (beta-lactamase superfamily II)